MIEITGIPAETLPAGAILITWGRLRLIAALSFIAGVLSCWIADRISAKLADRIKDNLTIKGA